MSPAPRFIRAQETNPTSAEFEEAAAKLGPRDPDRDPISPPRQAQSESDVRLESPGQTDLKAANDAAAAAATASGVTLTQSSGQPAMFNATGPSFGSATSSIPTLLRPEYDKGGPESVPYYIRRPPTQIRRTPEQYEAEYWEYTIHDPAKRLWLARRAIALGYAKYKPESPDLVDESEFNSVGGGSGIFSMWKEAGEIVRMNPALNLLTPEQYIDQRYNRAGGDTGFDELAKASIPNPIQKTTQTSTYTMSRVEAEAAADQIASRVLGHLASEDEMKRARSAMNSLLKANPTVSTTISDSTNPDVTKVSTHTKQGVSPESAQAAYEMKLKRSSEGMAFNVGTMMENAMTMMDRGL